MSCPKKIDYRGFYEAIFLIEQAKESLGSSWREKTELFFTQKGENSVTTKGEFSVTIDIRHHLALDICEM